MSLPVIGLLQKHSGDAGDCLGNVAEVSPSDLFARDDTDRSRTVDAILFVPRRRDDRDAGQITRGEFRALFHILSGEGAADSLVTTGFDVTALCYHVVALGGYQPVRPSS